MANSQIDADIILYKSRALRSQGLQQVIVCYQRALKTNKEKMIMYIPNGLKYSWKKTATLKAIRSMV